MSEKKLNNKKVYCVWFQPIERDRIFLSTIHIDKKQAIKKVEENRQCQPNNRLDSIYWYSEEEVI